ncbi:MAG: nitrogen regulatory protein PII [Maribacter sp.]|jgi:nitrogen regulatory protein PII
MKKIEAIIRLSKFDDVKYALAEIGVLFFTLSDVKGFGLQKEKRVYRGSSYDPDYIARLQIDILTTDDKIDKIVSTIKASGSTGKVGDGKIIVFDIGNVYRIRNNDEGANAI